MGQDTERALEEARARANTLHAEADEAKRVFLGIIADEMPGQAEELAKRTAHAQPDMTKALGKDGIRKFRTELRERVKELANEVRSGAEQIQWPTPQSEFSRVTDNDLHHVLFKFLYGPRVNAVAEIFESYGFHVRDDYAERPQGLVLPQYLYSRHDQLAAFRTVARALNAAAAANRALKEAQEAHDRAVVESIWEDE